MINLLLSRLIVRPDLQEVHLQPLHQEHLEHLQEEEETVATHQAIAIRLWIHQIWSRLMMFLENTVPLLFLLWKSSEI